MAALDIVVSDTVEAFTNADLARARKTGADCSFCSDDHKYVLLLVPIDMCDSVAIKALRGKEHPNLTRRHDLHG